MEILQVINFKTGKGIEQRVVNNNTYLLVPTTILVEGVLNGSAGKIFYPKDQILNSVSLWNGIPLVIPDHPLDENGEYVSVNSKPEILASNSVVGFFANSHMKDEKSLAGIAWLRVDNANKALYDVIRKIRSGQSVEVSTGLFMSTEPVENEAYNFIGKNYRPDHIAILVSKTGACSNKDGCGLNVNKGDESVTKQEKIEYLVANCDVWKNQKEILKEIDEGILDQLKANVERSKKIAEANALLLKGIGLENLEQVTSENVTNAVAKLTHSKEEPKKLTNKEEPKKLTDEEWFNQAPSSVKQVIHNAQKVSDAKRVEIINALLQTVKEEEKANLVEELKSKSLEELELIQKLVPKSEPTNQNTAGFNFGNLPLEVNSKKPDENKPKANKPLVPPRMVYGKGN